MTLPTFRALAASTLVYAAAVAVMGRNVLASLATAIAADVGDPVLNASILAWNARTLPWTDAWFDFPGFHPAADALTFSEHLLGVSTIAAPLYWMTGDAIVAYNLTLLAGYVLTGIATFALVLRLTRSRVAAFVAGAAFAFAPYRASHLAHIQVGIVFWAPLALLGLHAYLDTGRRRWLVLFGTCWLLQGASNGYFLVFFSVLVALWVAWFVVVPRRWRDLAMIGGTMAVAALPLVPILARFAAAHAHYGFSRRAEEVAGFSARIDAVGCAATHLSAWGWLSERCRQEGELFPGLSVLLLSVGGAMVAIAGRRRTAPKWRVPKTAAALIVAAAALLTASVAIWDGPIALRVSASSIEKPMWRALALAAAAAAWWIGSPRLLPGGVAGKLGGARRTGALILAALAAVFGLVALSVAVAGAWQWNASADLAAFASTVGLVTGVLGVAAFWWRPDVPHRLTMAGFYLVAALFTWILAWGPVPLASGGAVLPQAPYAWLMLFPGMDSLRVPARFWMMTALCLSVLAGFAAAVIVRRWPTRRAAALVSLAAAGLLIDGWATMPAAKLLPPAPNPDVLRNEVVLTLPLGSNRDFDIAAQFGAVTGGWSAVNGYSGYEPAHYDRLRRASAAADPLVLAPFLARRDLHVIVADNWNALTQMVDSHPGARRVAATRQWRQYWIPRQGRLPPHQPAGRRLGIAAMTASCSEDRLPLVVDDDFATRWDCGPQQPAQQMTIDVGSPSTIGTVIPALGAFSTDYPRQLRIETSADGRSWEAAWDGPVLAELIEAEFHAPRANRLVLAFAPRQARFVRLQLMSRDDVWYWSIAELEVWSGAREQ